MHLVVTKTSSDQKPPTNDHKPPKTISKQLQTTTSDQTTANHQQTTTIKKKNFFFFRIPIILFFCKLETKWGLADLNKHYVTSYIHAFATHDILIYLFLIRVSLELETPYSRKLIYLLFIRFFIILCETVIIDFNVNKDLSVSRDIT